MTPPRIVTPERAKEIEARLAKATPGPWDNEGTSYVYGMVPGGRPNGEILLCCSIRVFQGTHEQDKRNAEFIAHSWEDLRDLLYTLAVEREENARLWQYHGGHMPECGGLDEVERRCACGYLQGEAYRELVDENARLRGLFTEERRRWEGPLATGQHYYIIEQQAFDALAPRGEGKHVE